ncbi:MAG TPA: MarR family winged helix-turn-helix transcriptional regulator [Candidatus Peribacteraceae bacterium]|nr:MarR family winged helix-turn-helix transcriptional regulator [Candidatus Peribacteraceae bacterium]
MITLSPRLSFFLALTKSESTATRLFDARLGGLSFNEFIMLYHLSQSKNEKMRRIDLAERVGLTASGITRLIAPMEKIGLVKREASEHDARVSNVALAPGGKRKLTEAMEDAELLAKDLTQSIPQKKISDAAALLEQLGK